MERVKTLEDFKTSYS
ncbi:hypothetical protein TGMAS_412870, partial [Toxoplasma gondii MAS]